MNLVKAFGIFSGVLILGACSQNISQVVNVDNNKQNALLERIANQIGPSPTSNPSQNSGKSLGQPLLPPTQFPPQPVSQSSLSQSDSAIAPNFEIFQQDLPQPTFVKSYQPSDIAKAVDNWKIRYQNNSQSPYEVLRMAVDARLLSSQNLNLTMALLDIITTEPFHRTLYRTKKDLLEYERKNSTYMSEVAAGMYGFSSDKDASAPEHAEVFKRRALRIYTNPVYEKNKPLERPEDLTPAFPKESDYIIVRVIYENYFDTNVDTIAHGFEAGVVFESGKWKLLPDSFRVGGVITP